MTITTKEIIEFSPRLFRKGDSMEEIARRFGISVNTVESVIRQHLRMSHS